MSDLCAQANAQQSHASAGASVPSMFAGTHDATSSHPTVSTATSPTLPSPPPPPSSPIKHAEMDNRAVATAGAADLKGTQEMAHPAGFTLIPAELSATGSNKQRLTVGSGQSAGQSATQPSKSQAAAHQAGNGTGTGSKHAQQAQGNAGDTEPRSRQSAASSSLSTLPCEQHPSHRDGGAAAADVQPSTPDARPIARADAQSSQVAALNAMIGQSPASPAQRSTAASLHAAEINGTPMLTRHVTEARFINPATTHLVTKRLECDMLGFHHKVSTNNVSRIQNVQSNVCAWPEPDFSFEPTRLLGKGGFGRVEIGVLTQPSGQQFTVARKVLAHT